MSIRSLDARFRRFETAHDHCVLPGIFMVARLDGRSFTRLVRQEHEFEAPFDVRFRDAMVETLRHLMTCGFPVRYGYTQSDELSLLFPRDISTFGRKLRKFNSILAGEASAAFTHALGIRGAFDARISQLPGVDDVVDYFLWRQSDAHRNALSGHCYWLLRGLGRSEEEATAMLQGASVRDRNELLFQHGINFNELPAWEKSGIGARWETRLKSGRRADTGEPTEATRRELELVFDLPRGDAYRSFLRPLAV
ncbi:MAG: tRNA(His) guanylyltransferase Thg1 family protein [Myxococcota bacterium]